MEPENNPETKSVDSTLDDLLSNPFGTDALTPVQQQEISHLQSQEQADRLVDKLPEERQAQARELAKKIDVNDSQAVISYGSTAQTKLSEFSQSMLNTVSSQDIGPIGDSLNQLMYRLNEANPDELRVGEGNIFQKMFGNLCGPNWKEPFPYKPCPLLHRVNQPF